jgi:hypothetical protein
MDYWLRRLHEEIGVLIADGYENGWRDGYALGGARTVMDFTVEELRFAAENPPVAALKEMSRGRTEYVREVLKAVRP